MKLTDVPEDFRSKYVLNPAQVNNLSVGYIVPSTNDCNGSQMPQMGLKIKGLYDGDIVKLKHPTTGEEFIVRRTEVMTRSGSEIVELWENEVFRKEIEPILISKDSRTASLILEIPACAVWAKLKKARRLGIPNLPAWFK